MIQVIIGQRGVGKSALLHRWKIYAQQRGLASYTFFDLDQEIERGEGQSLLQIFSDQGEAHFRQLEKKYFNEIRARQGQLGFCVVAVGGGFDVNLLAGDEMAQTQTQSQSESQSQPQLKNQPQYLSVSPSPSPSPSISVLWVQRVSDESGRIFLDRPPLNPEVSPLEEFFLRASQREPLFRKVARREYLMPEGIEGPDPLEEKILFGDIQKIGGVLTLLPEHFSFWEEWIEERRNWGLRFFEVRDDLLNLEQQRKALEALPGDCILWSRRRFSPSSLFLGALSSKKLGMVDWDWQVWQFEGSKNQKTYLETLGRGGRLTLSFHEWPENLDLSHWSAFAESWEKQGAHIKCAFEVSDFEELERFHRWFLENENKRSFLPRSKEGRWQWYRLWMADRMGLNFLREGRGSASDQPTLYQWINRRENSSQEGFAALLGDPVSHSRTPLEHQSFFHRQKFPVLAIKVPAAEFQQGLAFLKTLGLRAAAVTSPLKKLVFDWAMANCEARVPQASSSASPITESTALGNRATRNTAASNTVSPTTVSERALALKSANTMALKKNGSWYLDNTDGRGFDELLAEARRLVGAVPEDRIAVWGGGGTLKMIQSAVPLSVLFSVQSGKRRKSKEANAANAAHEAHGIDDESEDSVAAEKAEGQLQFKSEEDFFPTWVIWASGAYKIPGTPGVPSHWRPALVIDLNYREDSGGKELAKKTGARYLSGLIMFKGQARGQREFWEPIFSEDLSG